MKSIKYISSNYAPFLFLNLAAAVFGGLISYGVVVWFQHRSGGISGPYLGQVSLYPGVYIVTWSLLVEGLARFGVFSFTKSDRVRLRTRSLPFKLFLFLVLSAVFTVLGVFSLHNFYGTLLLALILLIGFGFFDRKVTQVKKTVSQVENVAATGIFFVGLMLIVLGTPLGVLLFG